MAGNAFPFRRPGLAAGVACTAGAWLGLDVQPSHAVGLAAGALAGALAALLYARPKLFLERLGWLGLLATAGLAMAQLAPRGVAAPELASLTDLEAPVRFVGRLAQPINRRLAPPRWKSDLPQSRMTLVVDVDALRSGDRWVPTRFTAQLSSEDFPVEAGVGDAVEGAARFVRPQPPLNPGEPDQARRIARQGLSYFGSLERGSLAVLRPSDGIGRRSERFREAFTAFVRTRLGPGDRSALVAALAVGERGSVSSGLADAFNTSGLAHILSISGLHLAVAVLVLAWVLRRAFALSSSLSARIAPKRLAAMVALPLTIGYVILIGAPPPAIRAGIGLGIVLLGSALGRDPDTLNSFGWALAGLVMIDPSTIDDPSTQLSFLGVLGLIYFTERLRELVPVSRPNPDAVGWRRQWHRAREAVLMLGLGSIAATLATAPITAIHFERASLVAALANVLAWPASTLIVPAGALAAAVFPFSEVLAGPLVHLAGACAWSLAWCARFFAAWPAAAVRVAPPTPSAIFGYAVLVVFAANLLRWRRPVVFSGVTAGIAILLIGALPRSGREGWMDVTFLAVGQGDSTVIRFPHGSTMVVDAGGDIAQRFDPGERVVTPFLRSQGIRRIDVLVATHPHPDHIGGLPALLERFAVGEFWENGERSENGALNALISAAHKRDIPVQEFHKGLPDACAGLPPLAEALPEVAGLAVGDPRCSTALPERLIDGVRIQILHPLNGPEKAAFPELGENDNSLVLRLTYGDVHVLLPGDIEHEGEALLLGRGVDLTADIEKAPHHGSKTSSTEEFIKAVHPKYVVFCVGEHNQFGFPAPTIEARYQAAGCQRLRTDLDGAITFRTDGRQIVQETFRTR